MKETNKLRHRRSVRHYTKEKIPQNVVEDAVNCARLAPTARNVQPWLIGVVTDGDLLTKLSVICDHGKFIKDSAATFAVFCLRDEKYYLEDGCAAAMNLIHALNLHGVGSCWVAGDKKHYCQDVARLLNVGEEYTLVAVIASGYPAQETVAPLKKDPSDVCFFDRRP